MATVTHRVATPSTSNTTSYAAASFTPAVGDLIVVLVEASGTVAAAPTLTDNQSGTYTLIRQQLRNANADSQYLFVRNALVASAVGHILTFDCSSDAATGATVAAASVSGLSRTGASAVRQSAGNNGGSAVTPAATFGAACLTGNPVFAFASNTLNPAAFTPPATFAEKADTGYSTPAKGLEYATVDSGFTGTAVTWGAVTTTNWGTIVAELDTKLLFTGTLAKTSTLSSSMSAAGVQTFNGSMDATSTLVSSMSGVAVLIFNATMGATSTLVSSMVATGTNTPDSSGHNGTMAATSTLVSSMSGVAVEIFNGSMAATKTLISSMAATGILKFNGSMNATMAISSSMNTQAIERFNGLMNAVSSLVSSMVATGTNDTPVVETEQRRARGRRPQIKFIDVPQEKLESREGLHPTETQREEEDPAPAGIYTSEKASPEAQVYIPAPLEIQLPKTFLNKKTVTFKKHTDDDDLEAILHLLMML